MTDGTVPDRGPFVVGVAGGSASGKSTVVGDLVRRLGPERVAVLRHDAYYHDLSHLPLEARAEVNVDHPDSLETALLLEHLGALAAGRAVQVPMYDFASQTRGAEGVSVAPAEVLIVEGILVLAEPGLRDFMDLRVYVHADEADRLERRVARDTVRRGRTPESVRLQHVRIVQPMHDRFVEPSRRWADVVVEGGGLNVDALDALEARIRAALREG